MDISKFSLFQTLSERMNWLSQRQKVLAENIANQNTPNYRPRDLDESDFRNALRHTSRKVGVTATASGVSLGVKSSSVEVYDAEVDSELKEFTPNGNAVIIEDQLMKVADTQAAYQTATNLYRKHLALIKIALGRPVG